MKIFLLKIQWKYSYKDEKKVKMKKKILIKINKSYQGIKIEKENCK